MAGPAASGSLVATHLCTAARRPDPACDAPGPALLSVASKCQCLQDAGDRRGRLRARYEPRGVLARFPKQGPIRLRNPLFSNGRAGALLARIPLIASTVANATVRLHPPTPLSGLTLSREPARR
jgi:hypothetical protein